jgi:serine phosphatase RsbU (regulator of sigma subunit)
VLAATWGDTTVIRVRPGKRAGVRELTGSTGFLGPNPKLPPVGTEKHKPGDAVIVCSDGITDFLGSRWREQLQESVERSRSATGVVGDLMERACLGGAGDHLSVGVHLV